MIQALLRNELLDAKTCAVCLDLDGIMRPIDDPAWSGELGDLAHPNCRMFIVPIEDIGTMDYTPFGEIPALITKGGTTQLLKTWEDLPMLDKGAEKLGKKITVDEIIEIFEPYELMGSLLGIEPKPRP
jgi:hypothetical protein